MTDPAQLAMYTDPSTYVNDLLKEAEEEHGEAMYLDGADDPTLDGASFANGEVTADDVADDEVLNDLEEN